MIFIYKELKNFFKAREKKYLFNYPVDQIESHIKSIPDANLPLSKSHLELKYYRFGSFLIHSINFPSIGSSGRSSRFFGEIINDEKTVTTIKVKIKGSYGIYIVFLLFVSVGILYLLKLIQKFDVSYLFSGLFLVIAIPIILIWYRKFSDRIIDEQVRSYLSKKFKFTEL